MNSTTEFKLYEIYSRIITVTHCTMDEASRIMEPLTYWVSTGRCSGTHIRTINNLNRRQIGTIARRIAQFLGNDYEGAVKSVREYLDSIEK